jgi:hypothetical protein
MRFKDAIYHGVDDVATIDYVDMAQCQRWNEHRKVDELRMLTGWRWTAKDGTLSRQGYKTMTVAYREAHYVLVLGGEAPSIRRGRLRLVKKAA